MSKEEKRPETSPAIEKVETSDSPARPETSPPAEKLVVREEDEDSDN